MFNDEILQLARQIINLLQEQNKILVTAESCTGGLIAACLTEIPGASNVLYGAYVTYANQAKINMINVPYNLINKYGAVSEQVAITMAKGALKNSKADIAISVTGIAGPGGGTKEKPVGLVHFACAYKGEIYHEKALFGSDKQRDFIRKSSVISALKLVQKTLIN